MRLISTNGECELPCLWSLRPGNTTVGEMHDRMGPLSIHFREPVWFLYPSVPDPGAMSPRRLPFFSFGTAHLLPTDSTIPWIESDLFIVRAGLEGVETTNEDLREATIWLSLSGVLSQYGEPSRVLLRARLGDRMIGEGAILPFGLGLLYDRDGFAVFYETPVVYASPDGIVRHCFQWQVVRSVGVFTHSPGDGRSIADVIFDILAGGEKSLDDLVSKGIYHDLIDATGVTISEFYNTYRVPSSRCLESPLEIWPN